MKIIYFYQYFSTPKGSWGTRVYEFTKLWVERGHEVTVVTSIYSKSDITASKLLETQEFDGIKVKIINVLIDNKQPVLKRIWSFVQYMFFSLWYALSLPADVVVASSGPISVGVPGLLAKWLRRKKLVFEVRDLWPGGAIEMGIIRNSFMKWLLFKFEQFLYYSADLIVTLSPGMKNNIISRFPGYENKVISVPNAANLDLFSGDPDAGRNAEEVFKNRKIAIYTGNIGQVNNSGLLLEAARLLQKNGRKDIHILLIGDGQLKDELQRKIDEEKLETISIKGLMPKTELISYIKNSMVSLIPLKDAPILNTSSPNKLFESMAAGVAVVQTTQGWIKDFIEKEQCGITVSPNDPKQLYDVLTHLAQNENETKVMGAKGRVAAEKYFNKTTLSKKMIDAIENI
jgi:glycosyltransferase involved in cell wall biosynthesis